MLKHLERIREDLGAAPGVEHEDIINLPGGNEPVTVTCIDYCPSEVHMQEIQDLQDFLERHRPEWSAVRWINVDGLSDMHVIHALATKYELHPLAIEDLLHLSQRAKVEPYSGDESQVNARLFIVAHAIELKDASLYSEQVSIFLGHKTVLTFQEKHSQVWEPIRQRIKTKGSRLRVSDASFLVYSLLDAIVDHCFPLLEHYGDHAEELEEQILEGSHRPIGSVHHLKRDLLLLRRVVWPMREVVATLQREPHECISDTTRVYMRDLYDHVIQMIDILEIYHELANDLTETYMSSVSNRMNEVMKVLTMIGTIFIPLTFLAGVYGMNFRHFPELDQVWAYPLFWFVCVLVVVVMVIVFRRRNWL